MYRWVYRGKNLNNFLESQSDLQASSCSAGSYSHCDRYDRYTVLRFRSVLENSLKIFITAKRDTIWQINTWASLYCVTSSSFTPWNPHTHTYPHYIGVTTVGTVRFTWKGHLHRWSLCVAQGPLMIYNILYRQCGSIVYCVPMTGTRCSRGNSIKLHWYRIRFTFWSQDDSRLHGVVHHALTIEHF